jgi:DNA-directed RNA polymerase subunit RPC12/RpoP
MLGDILAAIAQAIRPDRCPYCGERTRVRPRLHVAVWH